MNTSVYNKVKEGSLIYKYCEAEKEYRWIFVKYVNANRTDKFIAYDFNSQLKHQGFYLYPDGTCYNGKIILFIE